MKDCDTIFQLAALIGISYSYVYGSPKYLPLDENHPTFAFNPFNNETNKKKWKDFIERFKTET